MTLTKWSLPDRGPRAFCGALSKHSLSPSVAPAASTEAGSDACDWGKGTVGLAAR